MMTCLVSCKTLGFLPYDAVPYQIVHDTFDDVEQPFETDSMVFFRKDNIRGQYDFALAKHTTPDGVFVMLIINFIGKGSGLGTGEITLKTDRGLYHLRDEKPHRYASHTGKVLETILAEIAVEALRDLAGSSAAKIQYYGEAVTPPSHPLHGDIKYYEETITLPRESLLALRMFFQQLF
jgi:hypothetical protein